MEVFFNKAINCDKPVYFQEKWFNDYNHAWNDYKGMKSGYSQQLFLLCSACDGKGTYEDIMKTKIDLCSDCEGNCKTLIQAPIEILTEITELLKVEKPDWSSERYSDKAQTDEGISVAHTKFQVDVVFFDQAQNKLNQIIEEL